MIFRQRIKNRIVFSCMIILGIGYQLFSTQKHIYQYAAPSHYPELIGHLQKNNINKIITTTGINIVGFADETMEIETAFSKKELVEKSRQKNIEYALIDNYYLATKHDFDSLKHISPIIAFPERLLCSPYLFLEHSEYTGFSFDEMSHLYRLAQKDSLQLRLIKINLTH